MSSTALAPTWGYKPDGSARIFDLAPDEGLPDGWHASPDCIVDPALATGEALSEAAARAARTAEAPPAARADHPRTGPAQGAGADAMAAENERLRSDNAALLAELAVLREHLAAVEDERARAIEKAEDLSGEIARHRATAPSRADWEGHPASGEAPEAAARSEDGISADAGAGQAESSSTPERSDEPAPSNLHTPPRSREEARAAVRALLGEPLTDREIARRVGVSPSTVAAIRKRPT